MKEIFLIWTECSSAENISFKSISNLQEYIKKEYFIADSLPKLGYDKHKIKINTRVIRLDVGVADFNPFTDNLERYLSKNNFIGY